MIINFRFMSWINDYGFPSLSFDTDTLELDLAKDYNTTDTMIIDTADLNQTQSVYQLVFTAARNFTLYLTVSQFQYNNQIFTLFFYEMDTIKADPAENIDENGVQKTIKMPIYIQITNGDIINTWRLYRRYELSDYYKGITFNNDMNWIQLTARFKTTLNKFSYEYLKEILNKAIYPIFDDRLFIIYNFISSCIREPNSQYLLVPPVITKTQKDSTW